MNWVEQTLDQHRREGTFRELRLAGDLVDFSSNDYLGLSQSPQIRRQLIAALEAGCPLGATGSRLLSGNTPYHARVESFLAKTFSSPAALLFSSGFAANQGVMSALAGEATEFFSDELNHASLVDGMRLGKSARSIFRHGDMNDLEAQLKRSRHTQKVIVSESVFSMDGDLADLESLLALARHHQTHLVIDEAHATGVFGLGRTHSLNAQDVSLITVHTGGKALGGQGAFVLCQQSFRDLMINRARTFIFSTALSPLHALQMEFALEEILAHPEEGGRLLAKAAEFRKRLPVPALGESQIVPVVIGGAERTLAVAQSLRAKGFDVRAIRSPTVAKGSERLRLTLRATHTGQQIANLLNALHEVIF